MADLDTATLAAIGVVLAVGMTFFNLRLRALFLKGKISRAYTVFTVSTMILVGTSTISVLQGLGVTSFPASWREAAALIFRLSLFWGFYEVYRAWTKLGKIT